MTPCLPARVAVRELLEQAVKQSVSVGAVTSQQLVDSRPAFAASYVRDDGRPCAAAVCDLPLAAAAAAAARELPRSALTEQLANERLDEDLHRTVQEVLNALAALLNAPGAPHRRPENFFILPGEMPDPAARVILEPFRRVDYHVEVESYGAGVLTVVTR